MRSLTLAIVAAVLVSCGLPRDPEGTLQRVEGSSMRVGVVDHPPWVLGGDPPRGVEVQLVEGFAAGLDAEVEWVEGSEHEILEQLELGRLDLAIGGFTADNPWSSKVAFIQPYVVLGADHHVMGVPHGENAWIVRLERYLRSRVSDIPELLRRSSR